MKKKSSKSRQGKGGVDKNSSNGSRHSAGSFVFETENLCSHLLEYINEGILIAPVVSDGEVGNFILANNFFIEMSGYTVEELMGMSPLDLEPSEERDAGALMAEQVLSEKQLVFERDLLRKDGTTIPVRINSRMMEVEDEPALLFLVEDITEHRKTEETLRKSEATLRSIFSAAPIGMGILASDRTLGWVNEQFARMMEYSSEEITGKNARFLYPSGEEYERVGKEKHVDVKKYGIGTVETKMLRGDGVIIDVLLSSATILPGDFSSGLVFTAMDITERKESERALQENEELFRGFFMTSPDSVLLSRLDTGVIVDVSESFTKTTGYSREEALGRTSNDLNLWPDPEDRQRFAEKLKEEGSVHNWETVFLTKSGEKLHTLLSANIITYRDEPYILTMTRNINELMSTQRALRESEEKYRLLADNATDIIWTMDMNMNYTYFSPSVQRVRGFTAQEAVEQSMEEVLTPRSLLLARETMAKYMQEEKSGNLEPGQVVTLELEMYHKDGSIVWGEITTTFTRDADGNPTGIQGVTRDISERKKAEKALGESEVKFRNIIESSPMGIFLYRLENGDRLIFTESNHAASTILGIDTSRLVGMTIEEAFPALAETEIPEKFLEVATKGKPWSWDQVDYDHGGIRGAYEVNAFQSSPGVVVVYFLDVTEKKKGERALQESEERFRTVFRKSPDALAIMSAKDRAFVDVSDGFTRITGYSREEVVGKAPTELNAWVDRDLEQTYLERLRSMGSVVPMEAQFRNKDGSVFTGIISANMVSISGESHVIAIIGDITQLKSAESALRESEEKYRLLITNIPDVTWISDEKGRTTFVSPNIEGIYGYTPDEIFEAGDKLWFDRIHPEDVAKVKDSFEELFSKASGFDIEYRIQRKDGEWIWLHDRAMTSFEREGARYAYGVFSDITRQKEIEEERKKVQAKLIQANKMTSLGLMVSSVAHEINNPNNFIMFNSQLIADFLKDGMPVLESYAREHEGAVFGGLPGDEFGEVLPKLLNGITDGTKMITSIVNELKDFVRQSHQAINVEIEVNDIVRRSHAIIDNHIRKFTDNLTVELGDDLPRIYGNKQQLIQVIVNLILNALEALPDKKHGIRISTGLSDNRDKVEIHVVDEGSGIPDELLGEVSEPFFTTKQEMGGTGLGLAICYSIISDHGGTMTIESIEGQGTTVSIFLPVSKSGLGSLH